MELRLSRARRSRGASIRSPRRRRMPPAISAPFPRRSSSRLDTATPSAPAMPRSRRTPGRSPTERRDQRRHAHPRWHRRAKQHRNACALRGRHTRHRRGQRQRRVDVRHDRDFAAGRQLSLHRDIARCRGQHQRRGRGLPGRVDTRRPPFRCSRRSPTTRARRRPYHERHYARVSGHGRGQAPIVTNLAQRRRRGPHGDDGRHGRVDVRLRRDGRCRMVRMRSPPLRPTSPAT